MRHIMAGLLLTTLLPALALAQVRGEIESIGFDNHYRPDCWTPMVVKLTAETGQSENYIIEVIQEDLDRDLVLARRTISVNGTPEGQSAREQRFWMYFKPDPRGLPGPNDGLAELQDKLRVFLCDVRGKQLARLPITSTIIDIDPRPVGLTNPPGVKLILCLTENNQLPPRREYETVVGVNENVLMMPVRTDQLPEDPRGFDAVDAIIWFGGDPQQLVLTEKMEPLRQFVRAGGQLVICQPGQRDITLPFGDLMPVVVADVVDRSDLDPLRQIVSARTGEDPSKIVPSAPVRMAVAQAKPDTVVARWVAWEGGPTQPTPYIVRKPFGLGSVIWIAQNLSDPAITAVLRSGWPYIWDYVFDWRNDTRVIFNPQMQKQVLDNFESSGAVDLGGALLSGMEHTKRASLLITLAVLFFLAYWIVAGPGIYLYLVGKRQSHWSWFLFGASALAAAAITVLLVQLVLRGAPAVHHISIVQVAPDQPAIVRSRFGLYIPRDGMQRIALRDADAGFLNYLMPFAQHPALGQTVVEFPARMEYAVDVRSVSETTSQEPASIAVPYRSTLKKFEARWTGTLAAGAGGSAVAGSARLTGDLRTRPIEGTLTNGSGKTLRNVYVAFTVPTLYAAGQSEDQVMYFDRWEPGVTLKLENEYGLMNPVDIDRPQQQPGRASKLRGVIGTNHDWDRYWFGRVRRSTFEGARFDDSDSAIPSSFPMLTLFDRLPPRVNQQSLNVKRFELLRSGARHLDLSQQLAAGRLVVLAEADGPLPFPLEVDGDIIGGEGTVLYQFALPLDRSAVDRPPTTQGVEE